MQRFIYSGKKPQITQHEIIEGQAEVVMFGDSLTEGGLWSELLFPTRAYNRGVGGDHLSHMLLRIEYVLSLEPKVVFILGGLNDLMNGKPVVEIMSSYEKVVKTLLDNKIEVVLQSTLKCSRKLDFCEQVINKIDVLNSLIKKLAERHGVAFLNLNKGLSSNQDGLMDQYTFDGVHLTGSAYKYWAQQVKNHLKKVSI